jgi:hypothetical protein
MAGGVDMWAIVRIALAEFGKAFAVKVGTPAARDFLWLTVFFTLSAFIVFVGWSARDGVWDRFQQVLLGALPEGGPPIRVATHIDLTQGISPAIIDRFEKDFPELGIVPMRDFDGRSGAITFPGSTFAADATEEEKQSGSELSWGRASDGATAEFLGFAVALDSPLWRWIKRRSGEPAGLADRVPLVIAANRSLFQKHFRYDKYRKAIAEDDSASCVVRSGLPAKLSDPGDPAQLDTLLLKVQEWSEGLNSRQAFHAFKVIWVDSFPLPEQVAFIMPLQTAELAMAAGTWKGFELYFEGQGAATQRIGAVRLRNIDALSDGDRSRAAAEFQKVATCLGTVPAEQKVETTICGTKWGPAYANDSVMATDNAQNKRALRADESPHFRVPLFGTSSFDVSITASSEWPLPKHEVQSCIQGTRFASALSADQGQAATPGSAVADFTPLSSEVVWKGPSRIELPCKILTAIEDPRRLLEQGSCLEAQPDARGIGRLPGYKDAMIYADATNKAAARAAGSGAASSGNLDDIVKSLLAWKIDDRHFAFRLDAAYESALVRFGVLSTIVDKMAVPLGGGMLVLYLVLSGVILATTFLHRRSQYGLLFMNGVRPWGIELLVLIQIALGCTIGCIIGYASFMIVASQMNEWLKSSDIIHKAAFIIGLDVPTFLDNLTLLSIVSIWGCMVFAGFAIGSIILRVQGISIAKAPIDLIKS